MIGRALDLIIIEWELVGEGTIQAGLAESRPHVFHHDLPTSIVFADPRYPRVYFLQPHTVMYD